MCGYKKESTLRWRGKSANIKSGTNNFTRKLGDYKYKFHISPREYYLQEIPNLKLRGDWGNCCCPFHDDHRPSFGVNLVNGGYNCLSCDAHGWMIDFHMWKYNVTREQALAYFRRAKV